MFCFVHFLCCVFTDNGLVRDATLRRRHVHVHVRGAGDAQREHYRSDFHRYNLKRKVAMLPPVTEAVYGEKIAGQSQGVLRALAQPIRFERDAVRLCVRLTISFYSFRFLPMLSPPPSTAKDAAENAPTQTFDCKCCRCVWLMCARVCARACARASFLDFAKCFADACLFNWAGGRTAKRSARPTRCNRT